MELITFKLSKNFARGYTKMIEASKDKYESKGQVGEYKLVRFFDDDGDCYYAALYRGQAIAFLYLEALEDMVAMEESVVWVSPGHRGNGLAETLYRVFIEIDNGILVSDSIHTEDGVALWNKFVANKIFKVFAHDLLEQGPPAQVMWDDDLAEIVTEPVTELWVVENKRVKHNYRLVAHK